MKKNGSRILLVLLLLLTALTLWVLRSKNKPVSSDKDNRKFAYRDTASLTRIFMADKEGHQCTLERKTEGWIVNGKYKARTEAILNLMEAIKNVDIKMSVPKESQQTVLKFMTARALKVELYAGDELVKQYYVGYETEDSEGTYMLLTDLESGKNYDQPYACFIPGFKGFLNPRFIVKENDWRDRILINYTPPQIREIKVLLSDFPPDSSFIIELKDTRTFAVKNLKGESVPYNEAQLKQYIIYFQNLSYERLITAQNKKLQDSLTATRPFCTISVAGQGFNTDEYKFYRMAFNGKVNPELGVNFNYDPDRLFIRFAGDREWAIGQYFALGKLFVSRNYFVPAPSVKK